jgi:hypothetical protein
VARVVAVVPEVVPAPVVAPAPEAVAVPVVVAAPVVVGGMPPPVAMGVARAPPVAMRATRLRAVRRALAPTTGRAAADLPEARLVRSCRPIRLGGPAHP